MAIVYFKFMLVQTAIVQVDYKNVIEYLKTLEAIADKNGGTRSVGPGHEATVKFLVEELRAWNDTFDITVQDVPLDVQVDEVPPHLIMFSGTTNRTFLPRLEVAVARGSGSIDLSHASLKAVKHCSFTSRDENWVAVIDPSVEEGCSACDRLVKAIDHGAKGAILIAKPGNQEGYPHPLPPSPGRCGRNPKYVEKMKSIGVVSVSDSAAFDFLTTFIADAESKVHLKVVSTFREYHSKNVIATSKAGDPSKIVLFGSHLDSVPAGPGVNDDGSGAMGTLELARAFHNSPLAKNTVQQVRFAWWTGEEIGLLGSIFYVNHLKETNPEELKRHKLSIDTDMLASPNYVRGVYDGETVDDPALKKKVLSISGEIVGYFKDRGLPTYAYQFNGRSDYAPFMENNIPSGGVATGADEIKTPEMATLFGGVAGVVLDRIFLLT
jgi:aminopeptidase Y